MPTRNTQHPNAQLTLLPTPTMEMEREERARGSRADDPYLLAAALGEDLNSLLLQAQEENPLSLEELFSWAAEILPITKTIGVIRSSSAIVSLISSSILIWIMNRSNARFSSIYHRMLLGMSVGDIFYSLSLAHFNSAAPSDVDYYVWNARGNQATCSAQGFVAILAATISVYYTCSLNL